MNSEFEGLGRREESHQTRQYAYGSIGRSRCAEGAHSAVSTSSASKISVGMKCRTRSTAAGGRRGATHGAVVGSRRVWPVALPPLLVFCASLLLSSSADASALLIEQNSASCPVRTLGVLPASSRRLLSRPAHVRLDGFFPLQN